MSNEYKTIAEEDVENIRNGHTYKLKVYLIPWRDEYRFELEDMTDIDLDVHDYLDIPVDNKKEGLAKLKDWRGRFRYGRDEWLRKQAERMVMKKNFCFYKEYTYDGFTRRTKYRCEWTEIGIMIEPFYNSDFGCGGRYERDKDEFVGPEELVDRIVQWQKDGNYVVLNANFKEA